MNELLYFILALHLILLVTIVYFLAFGFLTVPWIRTPKKKAQALLRFAEFKKGDRVLDLGSGDGAIVLEAAHLGGEGIGIEQLRTLVWFSRFRAKVKKLRSKTTFIHADIFKTDYPEVEIISCYLLPEVNKRIEPILKEKLPKGTKIVSRDFSFPGLTLIRSQEFGRAKFYLYKL